MVTAVSLQRNTTAVFLTQSSKRPFRPHVNPDVPRNCRDHHKKPWRMLPFPISVRAELGTDRNAGERDLESKKPHRRSDCEPCTSSICDQACPFFEYPRINTGRSFSFLPRLRTAPQIRTSKVVSDVNPLHQLTPTGPGGSFRVSLRLNVDGLRRTQMQMGCFVHACWGEKTINQRRHSCSYDRNLPCPQMANWFAFAL